MQRAICMKLIILVIHAPFIMMNNFQIAAHMVRPFGLNAMASTRPNTHTSKDLVLELLKAANSAHVYQVTVGLYGVNGVNS